MAGNESWVGKSWSIWALLVVQVALLLIGVVLTLGVFTAWFGVPLVMLAVFSIQELQRARRARVSWLPRWLRVVLLVEAACLSVSILTAALWSDPDAGSNVVGFGLGFLVLALLLLGVVGATRIAAVPPPPADVCSVGSDSPRHT